MNDICRTLVLTSDLNTLSSLWLAQRLLITWSVVFNDSSNWFLCLEIWLYPWLKVEKVRRRLICLCLWGRKRKAVNGGRKQLNSGFDLHQSDRQTVCLDENAAIVCGFFSEISSSFPWQSSFTEGCQQGPQIHTKPPMSFQWCCSASQQQDTNSLLCFCNQSPESSRTEHEGVKWPWWDESSEGKYLFWHLSL